MPGILKQIITAVVFILFLVTTSVNAEIISKIAAVVNDAIITTYQLDNALEKALKLNPSSSSLSAAEKEKLRLKILDQLIEEELFKERVSKLRIKVSDADVEAAINDVQQQNKLTREQLIAALQQQGMTFETYRESLRKQILRFKLIGIEVQSKAEVTSAEVREYYREHLEDYSESPYMQLSRLTIPIPKGAEKGKIDDLRALAIEAQGRLEKGESVNTLLVSYATAGADGGDMGKFRIGELSESFDRVVRDLKVGEISEIVEIPNGFFLFKMDDRSSGAEKPFDDVRAGIEQILMEKKREETFKNWNKELRKEAYIDIRI